MGVTGRDAAARSFSHAFTLETPRDPDTWPVPQARPVPKYTEDALALGQVVSTLGKTLLNAFVGYAKQNNVKLEGLPEAPSTTPQTPAPREGGGASAGTFETGVPPGDLASLARQVERPIPPSRTAKWPKISNPKARDTSISRRD